MDKHIARLEVQQNTQVSSNKQDSASNLESGQDQQLQRSMSGANEQGNNPSVEGFGQNNAIKIEFNQSVINQNYFGRPDQSNSNLFESSGNNAGSKIVSDFDENDDNDDSDAISTLSIKSESILKEMGDDSNFKNSRNSSENMENGGFGARQRDGQIFNPQTAVAFLNEQYSDQYSSMSVNGSGYINGNCNRIIKIVKDDLGKGQESLQIPLLKILQSIEGGYEELIKYLNVITFTRFTANSAANSDNKISFYVVEVDIGLNTLFNVLRLLKEKQINLNLMQRIFQGFVDAILQMHARFQVVNQLGLHSIYMHSTNIFIIDIFDQSISFEQNPEECLQYIPEGDLLVSVKDKVDYFKKDIYNLAKCLISIEMLKEGYSFFHIIELFQKDNKGSQIKQEGNNNNNQPSFNFLLYGTKHNCNEYFLKTKKFISIEDGSIVLYEVQNIIEGMLQEDPCKRFSSIKLAMICQKSNLLMRDILYPYINEFPPIFQLDQDKNMKILSYPFKPLKQTQDIDNHATILKNEKVIFDGNVDHLRKPLNYCSVQIFQFYTFKGYFIQGFPYMKSQLLYNNNLILEGDCFNFIFKQWLIKSKVVEEVIITNLFQISKWTQENGNNIELPNVIIAGGNKKIIKLSNNYVMDLSTYQSVNSIIECVEFFNFNSIDSKVINSLLGMERLQNLRYLVIAIDTEEKAQFLINFLLSQSCANLETLDLSNSTKLEYKDYELNKTLNVVAGAFNKLTTVILNNCKSSAPYQFLTILMNYENFKRITRLIIDDTYVDSNIFAKMFDSPFLSSLKRISLDDTSGISDASVIQLSERLSRFKNLVELNISGMLKKNFNKNLFTDSNISAFKKLGSQMNCLIFLEKLVIDDSYINDSVLESISKSNMPSLQKIYLRKQQKVTYKGINYILQTQNFRNLKTINCNSSPSITLPKNLISHIELSVMNCKSVNSTNISEYLRTNPSASSIRFDAKNIGTDVITAVNLSKYIKKITLYCSEGIDISKMVMLFKNLDNIKKISFCINFHCSKNFIEESDYEFLGPNQYKRTRPMNGTVQQIIEDFRIEIKRALDNKWIFDKILENMTIHKQSYVSFYNEQTVFEQVDISSFISISHSENNDKKNLIASSSEVLQDGNSDLNSDKKKEIADQNSQHILPSQIQQKPIDTIYVNQTQESQENHLNTELKKKTQGSQVVVPKIQYLEDLQNFLNNPNLLSNLNSINLSSFQVGPDEMNFLTFSVNLGKLENLILQNSLLRSSDLKLFSYKALSMSSLTHIDLSNNKLSIIGGIVNLLKSDTLVSLTSIKLGQYKIKILIKNLTQSFRRVSVPLTLVSNFPKFNSENKIKVMVQNNATNKKYLETLDFYIKKGDFINEGSQFGHLKILMCPFISFYVRNCQKYPEQTHNLHRLMRFWRIKELGNLPFGSAVAFERKDEQIKFKEQSHLTLTVLGHELAGKRTIIESFLQSNFNDVQELVDIKQQHHHKHSIGSLSQINSGIRFYHTEFQSEQSKIHMTLKTMHSNPLFNQLRLNHLRDSDGICIIYDTSRKDIGPEMMQYLYEVHLFKYQKPVYVVANNFKSKKSVNIFDHSNLIPDIKYIDVSLSNTSSIKNFFNQITKDALITKMKKPVFSNNLLNELSEELTHTRMQEFEMKLDFLKVRNKVDMETLKSFVAYQHDNEHVSKMDLDIFNWGNFGKSAEELLNKIGEQKIKVKVKNSISAYINN